MQISFQKPHESGDRALHVISDPSGARLYALFQQLRGAGGFIEVDTGQAREQWHFKSWPRFSGWQEQQTGRWRREPHSDEFLDLVEELAPALADLPPPRTQGKVVWCSTHSLVHVPVKVADGQPTPEAPQSEVAFTCEHVDGVGPVWVFCGRLDLHVDEVPIETDEALATWIDDQLTPFVSVERQIHRVNARRDSREAVLVEIEIA